MLRRPRAARARAAGLTLAVKGGHNGEHHNHNDVGIVRRGARTACRCSSTPGRPTYTAQTFGPDRYAIWTMQSAWHNVPVIRGREQLPGAAYAARDVAVEIGDDGVVAEPRPRRRLRRRDRRGAAPRRLDRGGRVTIDDAWDARRARRRDLACGC